MTPKRAVSGCTPSGYREGNGVGSVQYEIPGTFVVGKDLGCERQFIRVSANTGWSASSGN